VLQVVLAVLAGGLGLPVPEDAALLSAGCLLWQHAAPLAELLPAAIASVVLSDAMLYTIGRLLGARPSLRRRFGGARVARLEGAFARHGAKLVLVARFAIGCRAPFFVAAGAARMPLGRVLVWDAVGATGVVALWLAVGVRYGMHLQRLRSAIGWVERFLPLLVVLALAAVLLRRSLRRRRSDGALAASQVRAVR
jgi:membrane protein DedA with SNARE-associated domain